MTPGSSRTFGMMALAIALALPGCSRDTPTPLEPGVGIQQSGIADDNSGRRDQEGGREARTADKATRGLPEFDPDDFVRVVDNPFYPLTPGTIYNLRGETAEGVETNEIRVTYDTKRILGVRATVVRDRVWLEGSLIEETFDWFAQDEDGNVWYLGEDSKTYENGQVVSTEGSWEAGKDGARPGVIMLAHPQVGDAYPQEIAPGVAEDRARVVSLDATAVVPYGTFHGCVETKDTTPLEPGFREFKFYARGIGLVLEVAKDGERLELVSVTRF